MCDCCVCNAKCGNSHEAFRGAAHFVRGLQFPLNAHNDHLAGLKSNSGPEKWTKVQIARVSGAARVTHSQRSLSCSQRWWYMVCVCVSVCLCVAELNHWPNWIGVPMFMWWICSVAYLSVGCLAVVSLVGEFESWELSQRMVSCDDHQWHASRLYNHHYISSSSIYTLNRAVEIVDSFETSMKSPMIGATYKLRRSYVEAHNEVNEAKKFIVYNE